MARQKKFKDKWLGTIVHNVGFELDYFWTALTDPFSLTPAGQARLADEIYWEDVKLRRALKESRERHYIEMREKGNEILIRFLEGGLVELLKESIRSCQTNLPAGTTCLVIFDFPEVAKTAREFWRRFLKSADFEQIQLSCWASKHDVAGGITLLAKMLEADDWIKVYQAQEVSQQDVKRQEHVLKEKKEQEKQKKK